MISVANKPIVAHNWCPLYCGYWRCWLYLQGLAEKTGAKPNRFLLFSEGKNYEISAQDVKTKTEWITGNLSGWLMWGWIQLFRWNIHISFYMDLVWKIWFFMWTIQTVGHMIVWYPWQHHLPIMIYNCLDKVTYAFENRYLSPWVRCF